MLTSPAQYTQASLAPRPDWTNGKLRIIPNGDCIRWARARVGRYILTPREAHRLAHSMSLENVKGYSMREDENGAMHIMLTFSAGRAFLHFRNVDAGKALRWDCDEWDRLYGKRRGR